MLPVIGGGQDESSQLLKAIEDSEIYAVVLSINYAHSVRDEEKFLRKTIKLLRKMQNPQELFDVEHPVGIESRTQDIISALRLSDQAPTILAVFGISGSGKTTIVKSVYDRIAADFDVGCFIHDIHNYEYGGRNWKER
nr:TMV resistance protein N [Tanacetum cinerariifolium]